MSRAYHYTDAKIADEEDSARFAASSDKMLWFWTHKYVPHYYQRMFHTDRDGEGHVTRFRHLVAGRRGGKTSGAAEELAYYMCNPSAYWQDFHGEDRGDPLWTWLLTRDHTVGFPARVAFNNVLRKLRLSGQIDKRDVTEKKGEQFFEFRDGGMLQYKTAVEPESLVGAGLHGLWMDEAAKIVRKTAWEVVYPSLSDNMGFVITTTTPVGKNWYHDEFFRGDIINDDDQMRVEYTSLNNPHFPRKEWERALRRFHPVAFRREYMASFASSEGLELQGDWLQYYETRDIPVRGDLDLYVGVDPALSKRPEANRFAMALIGVTRDREQAYLLDLYAGQLSFPEQVEKINEWNQRKGILGVGIEANAYQAALSQQVMRLPTWVPVREIRATAKKSDRLLAMSPYFKLGRIKIRGDHSDFIDEWLSFDSSSKTNRDDCLDAVEIALRTAGVLRDFAEAEGEMAYDPMRATPEDMAAHQIRSMANGRSRVLDEAMGGQW